jgi:branched-chain amino acid transport system substrate-binding protein
MHTTQVIFKLKKETKMIEIGRKTALAAACCAALACMSAPAAAQISDNTVKIGVLTDLSGTYSDIAGGGTVLGTRMAIEDFVAKEKPKFKVEMVSADHQNKGDIASNKAREWFDIEKVDMVGELVTTSAALAVMKIAQEKNKVVMVSGGASTRITNEDCNNVTVHWTYDTYAVSNGTARAVVKQGGKSWFFLTADYTFGQQLEKDATEVIKAGGGTVVGSVKHPFPSADFSSFLVTAQASKAQVVGLANAGSDTANAIKQASEFGLTPKQSMAGLLMFISDVHSLGLKATQTMYLTEGFYWNLNDATRAWSKRFFERHKRMPTSVHAGMYSAVMHYLTAVKAIGTDDTAKVMAQMKKTPVNDFFATNGKIRDDGRMVHDMYLFQVKKPAESKTPWDYYNVLATIPAAEAFQPLSQSRCPLIKK